MSAPTTMIQSASLGLYVPIHKRAGSNTSSTLPSATPSYVYSLATLFSLQPFADESMKGKMHATCPEVVMTRKMRKGLEFNGKRTELSAAQKLLGTRQAHTPSLLDASRIHTSPPVQTTTRVLPRRSRPAGRRRNAFSSAFDAQRTGDDKSRRLHAVPMSPVFVV